MFNKLHFLTIISFILIFNANAFAKEELSVGILTPNSIRKVLGDFPAAGSKEEALDYSILLKLQNTRSTEECDYAESQSKANIKTIFASNNGPLSENEASRLQKTLFKYYAEAGVNILLAKKLYKRPRPYDANPEIKPCIELESSSAYPSGHAAIARVFAHLLSDILPARKEAFFKRANEAAMNRVIGGVHHPSDIIAGVKLGDEIYKLMKNEK
jgi:acid phosphatase (class A)